MNEYYFTFGSNPLFPYGINDYVLVYAENRNAACDKFSAKYPNRPKSGCINCAFVYSKEEFDKFRDRFYKGVNPIDVIV